jgi:CRP-like cAMP-binding protein
MALPHPQHSNQLQAFFHQGHKRVYKKGEIILYAGDLPQGVFLIEAGIVKIFSLSKNGSEHTHMFYRPADIFPLIWAFSDAIRTVYYQALENTTVWIVPKDEFKIFVSNNAEVALHLLEQTVDMFRLYAGRIDNLLYSNSYERTAYRLLSLIDRFGDEKDGRWVIKVQATHHDIASSVNLSRETVSRCLERMQAKNIISHDSLHRIVVNDLGALARIIGTDEVVNMWPQYTEYLV